MAELHLGQEATTDFLGKVLLVLNQEKLAISREQESTQTNSQAPWHPCVCLSPVPCSAQGSGAWLQGYPWHQDSPMQISSSVSASPMQRNLNSLRESANLRLAADRSAETAGEGKTQRLEKEKAHQQHDAGRRVIPASKSPWRDPPDRVPLGPGKPREHCPSPAPTPRTGLCRVPASTCQKTLQEMKPQNTMRAMQELKPSAMGQWENSDARWHCRGSSRASPKKRHLCTGSQSC